MLFLLKIRSIYLLNFLTHVGLYIEKLLLLYFDHVISFLIHFFSLFLFFLVCSLVLFKCHVYCEQWLFCLFLLTIFISCFFPSALTFRMELGPNGDLYSFCPWPMHSTLSSLSTWCWDLTELYHLILEYSFPKCGTLHPPPLTPKCTLLDKYFISWFKFAAIFSNLIEDAEIFVCRHWVSHRYNIYF